MALPININDLLKKNKVESNRIEFKAGWNPKKIYHSICAFANDIDNLGGGYILVGVEEENGIAKRPVKGISHEQIDNIQKEMIGFNNKIEPYYLPRISVEEIDDKTIIVILLIPFSRKMAFFNKKEIIFAAFFAKKRTNLF